jgi:membrane-bound lytic murein transglycosylase D
MTIRGALKRTRGQLLLSLAVAAFGGAVAINGLDHTHYLRTTVAAAKVLPPDTAASVAMTDSAADTTDTASMAAAVATIDAAGIDHPLIDRWIKRLTTSFKGDFELSLGRMDKYAGMISSKLAARDMPHDLIYLAMIESNFNPNAKSHAHAVGLWQFMSATAKRFGLTVSRHTDQRRDPARETDAALAYLSLLHKRFGSWYLAAAAYNSGEGTVSKALKRVTGKSTGTDEDFFRILPKLPKETRDYVPKLIASARIAEDPAKYGLTATH